MSIKRTVKKLELQLKSEDKNPFKVSKELEEAARARIRAAIWQPDRDGSYPEQIELAPEGQERINLAMNNTRKRAEEDRRQLAERGICLK